MVAGIILIIAGILIAVFPQLLSIIVAVVLIFFGIFTFLVSYRYKKMEKHIGNPFLDFFIRF